MEAITQNLTEFFGQYGFPPELIVFIISLMPILELRGGLLAASLLGVPWIIGYPISIIGNIIPVPFIIFFIERILLFLKDHGPIKKLAGWIERKGRSAGEKMQTKYPKSLMLGLFLFVAIPLPGTGAWTGSLAAALLGIKPKKAAVAIGLGVLGASIIMSVVSYIILPWLLSMGG